MDIHAHQHIASRLLARLGSAILPRYGRPAGAQVWHLPQVFDAAWISDLPLPIVGQQTSSQSVALVDGTNFHRAADAEAIAHAYQQRPRTRVYECINARSDGWYSLVALHLARLMRRRIICTMYESRAVDRHLGPHDDAWFGAIVHMRGAKRWEIWPEADQGPRHLLTQAGDVLLLPAGVTHDVSTPGYSAHLVFAITDEDIESSKGGAGPSASGRSTGGAAAAARSHALPSTPPTSQLRPSRISRMTSPGG